MKNKPDFKYERIKFFNTREGKEQYLILAKINGKIIKYRFEK